MSTITLLFSLFHIIPMNIDDIKKCTSFSFSVYLSCGPQFCHFSQQNDLGEFIIQWYWNIRKYRHRSVVYNQDRFHRCVQIFDRCNDFWIKTFEYLQKSTYNAVYLHSFLNLVHVTSYLSNRKVNECPRKWLFIWQMIPNKYSHIDFRGRSHSVELIEWVSSRFSMWYLTKLDIACYTPFQRFHWIQYSCSIHSVKVCFQGIFCLIFIWMLFELVFFYHYSFEP